MDAERGGEEEVEGRGGDQRAPAPGWWLVPGRPGAPRVGSAWGVRLLDLYGVLSSSLIRAKIGVTLYSYKKEIKKLHIPSISRV